MNLKPEQLREKGYVLLDKLEHKELVPFIRTYMKKRTRYSVFYYMINTLVFAWAGYFFLQGYKAPSYSLAERFAHVSYGLALAFALIPLHEYIHVLAYKSQGATHTSYDANLRRFYFMALADRFVANKSEFQVVALAPFVVITTGLLLLLPLANSNWTLTVAGVLLAHTAMCSGDFGLLSYFEYHKEKQVVTYDDVAHKISYFYGRVEEGKTTA